MFYVGLDIHCKHITMCILGNDGKIVQRRTVRQVDQMMRVLAELPDRFAVCYEASCGYGYFHELLTPLASRVVVAHPGLLRLIFRSRRKNDRGDAEKLAKLLYIDQVPTVHVPCAQVRAWRELIGYRQKLVQKRTRAKNGVRALLRTVGVRPPKRPALWTRQGMAWLRGCEFSESIHALKRDLLVEEIETLSSQQGGGELLRPGAESGSVGRHQPPGPHHARGAGGCPASVGRSHLAGGPPFADDRRLLRAHPTRRYEPQENRFSGHGPLSGSRDVGHVETRHLVERDDFESGRLTSAQAQQTGAAPSISPSPQPQSWVKAEATARRTGLDSHPTYKRRLKSPFHVEFESGIQVASRRVPWRNAMPCQ